MALSNFGEQFAAKTVQRFQKRAVTPAITNDDYEGELKKYGDRVNILSIPGEGVPLEDYVAGTDMSTTPIFDLEDQLVVEKRRSYNVPLDRLEELFTYVDNVEENISNLASQQLEREIDTYVLQQVQFAKAGSWVGVDVRVTGSSRDTEASVATTATGGTLSVQSPTVGLVSTIETGDGASVYSGFTSADVGKPVRLTSGASWASEWYRITAVTNSTVVSIENWDGAVAAFDIPNGDILRGLGGGFEFTGGVWNTDGKPTTEGGWGWELQAARATALTANTIYEAITLLDEKLNKNEIPDTDRHITFPSEAITLLKQASELQPAVAMAYEGVVINGRVAKVGGFDIHQAAGQRVTTRIEHSGSTGQGGDIVVTDGSRAFQILANHKSFCTFGYKWAEARTMQAENQFANKMQGLHLYGAKVPGIRRRAGALLFGTL